MPRRPATDLSEFAALALEGNLIAPAMLAQIARTDADAQSPADYAIPPGLTLRDEIARYFRIGQAHFDRFAKIETPTAAATTRFAQGLLTNAFGFADLAVSGAAPLAAADGRVPVVVVSPADSLDRPSPALALDGRRRSAASSLQDQLNANEDALWGLATNGAALRLMRDNASLTRPSYVEADLAQIFAAEDFASFAALWLLVHRSRFGNAPTPAADCPLERWREAGAREGEAARNRLRDGVEVALKALGTGFLDANPDLRDRLASGELDLTTWFNELLRFVYRLIFLMVAEDRDLLHAPDATTQARHLYADGYSLADLRRRAVRRTAWDHHHDRWEGLRVTFRALTRGEPRLGLPALGGLFAPGQMPSLESARLGNRALMEAVYRLSWLTVDNALMPVNWRAMETEELGSVYESLLELTPQLADGGRAFAFAEDAAETRGNQRKTTGSYYTPDSLVQTLLDSALDPVLDRIEAEADDPATALAAVTIIDPACGSGHFLLAAARRIATRLARQRAGGVASAADYRHALRDVARRCIHGVDRNPMAVELTKVALWIETVEPGRPLGFLDGNIRCGDALLGVFDRTVLASGIPDAAYKPLTGDDKDTAKFYMRANRAARAGQGTLGLAGDLSTLPTARPFARAFTDLRAMPEDDLAQIAAKAEHLRSLREAKDFHMAELACNLYVAAFLLPKVGGPPASRGTRRIPITEDLWQALRGEMPYGSLVGAAKIARAARAFHWPLEFPAVMARGGFDVVLGNPPWERIKLQEQEFFAARDPAIATAPNAAARTHAIRALAQAEPGSPQRLLFTAFEAAKHLAESVSAFVRLDGDDGGRFPLTGRGDVNTYALFAELFSRLAGPKGRAGVIVPTGIAFSDNNKAFFGDTVENQRLVSLFAFYETRYWFPQTDDKSSFCLLTLGWSRKPPIFVFDAKPIEDITDTRRQFTLTAKDVALLNPNTRTAPVFRSQFDAELSKKIYAITPVLLDEAKGAAGNPWGVTFARMFDMSNDSGLFRTALQLTEAGYTPQRADWVAEGARPRQAAMALGGGHDARHLDLSTGGPRGASRWLPLYEAKMIHQFDHRWATYAADGIDSRDATEVEKCDPTFEPSPRYWVPEGEVDARLAAREWTRGWLIGWRDICRNSDVRTVISTVFPRGPVGNNLPIMIFPSVKEPSKLAALTGCLGSLVCDFFARHKVGGSHLNYFIYQQIPLMAPVFYTEARLAFITPRVLELTYTSQAMAPFARDLGHTGLPFAWDEDRRSHLRADLDAFYARAYGLTRDELRYILDPADVKGPDYPSETFRVLKANDIRRFGDYRTARLVLAAWDRFDTDGTFAMLGL